MTVRLVDDRGDGTIPVRELRDGQLGTITQWGGHSRFIGWMVQPCCRELVAVGRPHGESWRTVPGGDDNRVRVLPNGTRFEVTDNE